MSEEKIILEKDVILPEKETIEVFNIGTKENPRYIVTEHTARKELATHKICEGCDSPIIKNSFCRPCSEKKWEEAYFRLKFKEWNYEDFVYDRNSERYFQDENEIEEYLEENENAELRLVICSPNMCPTLNEEYFTEDNMPENFDELADFDKGLVQKINELNEYISTLAPMSWSEGIFRTEYKKKLTLKLLSNASKNNKKNNIK